MDLEPTEEQHALRAGVAAVLERECPPAVVRTMVEKGEPPTALLGHAVEQGWFALTLPEEAGGLGLGAVELAIVAEETGRFVAPLPWLATAGCFASVIAETGTAEQVQLLLEPVAEGQSTGSLAVSEGDTALLPERPATVARETPDGWRVTGTKKGVLDADTADDLVVIAAVGDTGRLGAFVVSRSLVEVSPTELVDRTRPWGTVRLADAPARVALGEPGSAATDAAVRRGLSLAVVALCAETVGACRQLFERAVDYAKVRKQFGAPIGSFQAIKHKLADTHLVLERARATVTYAALCVAESSPEAELAVAAAKVAVSDAAERVARESLQVHGGIGYTWEHDLHLALKRARTNAVLFGTSTWHRQVVADLLGLPRAG